MESIDFKKSGNIFKFIQLLFPVLLALFLSINPVDNPDYGFHLRTGEDIVKNHFFPLTESYSFTAKGNFNPAYSWLFDAASYLFNTIGNINGLVLFQCVLVLILFTCVWLYLFKASFSRQSLFLSLLIIINLFLAFAFLYMPRIMIRPHLLGNIYLVLFILILPKALSGRNEESGPAAFFKNPYLWLTAFLFILWVNSHSSFAEAFAVLFIWIAAALVRRFFLKDKNPDIKNALILTAFLLCLSLANPNFIKVYSTFVPATKATEEFFSLFEVLPKSGILYIVIILSYLAVFTGITVYYLIKKDFFRSFLLFFFTLLGVYSVRFLGDLGIIAAVTAAPAAFNLTKYGENRSKFKALFTGAFIVLLVTQSFLIYQFHKPIGIGLSEKDYPVHSALYLNQSDLDGNMFNPFEWGGYLIWELRKYPVYIDGRVQVYPDEFINDFRTKILQKPPAYFYEQCRLYGISFAVVPYASNIGNLVVNNYMEYLFDRSVWALVYFDNNSLVYIKRGFSPKNDAVIKRDEYAMLQPAVMAPPLLDQFITNDNTRGKVIAELERSIAASPQCIYSHFCLAYVRFRLGDIQGAVKELEITRELFPDPQVEMLYRQLKNMVNSSN